MGFEVIPDENVISASSKQKQSTEVSDDVMSDESEDG